jgi:hypothetical protein
MDSALNETCFLNANRITAASIEITNECNLRCIYCGQSNNASVPQTMGFDVFKRIIRELRTFPIYHILLSGGGETTVVRDWHLYAKEIFACGIHAEMVTNFARRFSNDEVAALSRFSAITVSIDTIDSQLLASLRRRVQCMTILDNIKRVQAEADRTGGAAIDWTWNIVFSDAILPSLIATIECAHSLGMNRVRLLNFNKGVPLPEGMQIENPAELPPAAMRKSWQQLQLAIEMSRQMKIELEIQPGISAAMEEALFGSTTKTAKAQEYPEVIPEQNNEWSRSCLHPWNQMIINADQRFAPCCRIAPIFANSVFGYLESKELLSLKISLLNGHLSAECRQCPYYPPCDPSHLRQMIVGRILCNTTDDSNAVCVSQD